MAQKDSARPQGADSTRTLEYRVTGMTCAACSAAVEKAVRRVPGVISANVNLILERLTVEAPTDFDGAAVCEAVKKAVIFVLHILDIIRKKRDGGTLTKDEIEYFVRGCTDGSIPDYQLSAL